MGYRFAPIEMDEETTRRFWAKVSVRGENECWPFMGARALEGYGIFTMHGSNRRANRVAWALSHHGSNPNGLVCHRCDNPSCCNPAHLWVGDDRANQIDAAMKGRLRGQAQTHCANGHEFTPDNTYSRPGTTAGRQCRACNRAAARRYAGRKAA